MPLHYAINRCKATNVQLDGKPAIKLEGPCIVTGKPQEVVIYEEELAAYNTGTPIHEAFARIWPDGLEFLMSGHSKEGWDITFPPEEDGD